MNELKTYYYLPNIWERDNLDVENAYDFRSRRDIDAVNGGYDELEVSWLVESMAKDYLSNHDGWEVAGSWQGDYRDFVVWDSDKNLIGTFEVLLEYEPCFTAWRKK
jgi:hypothetical protein